MKKFMLDAKVLSHKNGFVTYLQKAEDIMDFLLVIGAMNSRIPSKRSKLCEKTRNDLNRANNAETANIARTISASMKQLIILSRLWIRLAWRFYRWSCAKLPNSVLPADYSIQQIADSIEPPLTKSGVNHRLRKINKIADDL